MPDSFLQRVHAAKARYTSLNGDWPDQLFLGPKEYMEFKELCAQYAMFSRTDGSISDECLGMTIIGLISDGIRVGKTVVG